MRPSEHSKRPSVDEHMMARAHLAAQMATCPRLHVGCVIAKDKRALLDARNGSLPGQPHCDDVGCLMVNGSCQRTNHSEANAVALAAKLGISLQGATAYITHSPCATCAKLLVAAGITEIVYAQAYRSTDHLGWLTECGVIVRQVEESPCI